MTETQFDNGYFYAVELKEFAEKIGIPAAKKLRKDELEVAIKFFLRTGQLKAPTQRDLTKTGVRDIDKGLHLDLPVVHYTSNRETKDFIVREAHRIAPDLKRKSGVRYRLNRFREDQLTKGIPLTYGDLVKKYVELHQTQQRFAQIPIGRYVNFMCDFLAAEKNATREEARKAWEELKNLDIPKNYHSWVKSRSVRKHSLK